MIGKMRNLRTCVTMNEATSYNKRTINPKSYFKHVNTAVGSFLSYKKL